MPRPFQAERFEELIAAATQTFIASGYQRAQMDEIAARLGIAKGSLYAYVESKTALLDAALRFADGLEPLPRPSEFPLATPASAETLQRIRARLDAEMQSLELFAALERKRIPAPAAELEAIVHDLYRRLARNRCGIKLLDRCASEMPEFAEVWFGAGRWALHGAIAAYIEARVAAGHFAPPYSIPIAARAVLESINFWAVHRHWDPSPQAITEADVEATLVQSILRWLIKETN